MLTFAATTGIITAVLNQAFALGRDLVAARSRRKALAGYHALRLAALLEGYAYDCASFIGENFNPQQPPDEPYPAYNANLPDLQPYPEEIDGWHSLDLRLAGRALDLRNHIKGSVGVIASIIEYSESELGETLDEHAALRGQEAWVLAKDLRRRYGLPPFEPVWDFTDTLDRALTSAREVQSERMKSRAALDEAFKEFSKGGAQGATL